MKSDGLGGSHELLGVGDRLEVELLVLSLVLAPLATELPEKANSFLWVREGKDALALGNITGAMVFQSTIPIAIGILVTSWELDRFAVLSMVLGLAGVARRLLALRLPEDVLLWDPESSVSVFADLRRIRDALAA